MTRILTPAAIGGLSRPLLMLALLSFLPGPSHADEPRQAAPDKQDRARRSWAPFPPGAFVVWADVIERAGQVSQVARVKHVFQEFKDGKEMVSSGRWAHDAWQGEPTTLVWMQAATTPEDHEFVRGNIRTETLLVDKKELKCAVSEYSKGAPADRIETVGAGGEAPLVPNLGPANQAKNRRVELVVVQ